jgi:hypothetical protein
MRNAAVLTLCVLVELAFWAAPLTSFAGGTITGKVTYSGKSEEKEFLFSKYPNSKFCAKNPKKELVKGAKRVLPTIEVGKELGLKSAVVAIADIEDEAFIDPYKGTNIVAEFCEFMPFIGVVVKQKNFHVENHDTDPEDPESLKGVLYTVHLFEEIPARPKTIFNGQLERGSKLDRTVGLKKKYDRSVFRLQCDMHEFMRSFFVSVTNPYYAVTKEDGSFEIMDVPAGKHWVYAWHPFAGEMHTDVEVSDGGTTQIEFELEKLE